MGLLATNTGHSFENALVMAQASGLAYADDEETIKTELGRAVGQIVKEFKIFAIPVHDTSVYVAGFDAAVLVSFRGSRSLANWLSNIEIQLTPFRGGGMVHRGFRMALDGVFADLDGYLDDLSGQGRTVWLTGHSLGGALALLAAAYWRFPAETGRTLPRPLAGIYTFGQPRVGTHAFCDACTSNFGKFYFRYINRQDIVTRVPPRELAYWHIDNLRYITEGGSIESDIAWWQIFLDRVKAGIAAVEDLRVTKPLISLVQDHSIKDYIAAIQNVIDPAHVPASANSVNSAIPPDV